MALFDIEILPDGLLELSCGAVRAATSAEKLTEHKHEIEVFYLPSYSPELNPNEMVNGRSEAGSHQARAGATKQQLVKATAKHPRSVERKPERIKNYFEHEPIHVPPDSSLLMPAR